MAYVVFGSICCSAHSINHQHPLLGRNEAVRSSTELRRMHRCNMMVGFLGSQVLGVFSGLLRSSLYFSHSRQQTTRSNARASLLSEPSIGAVRILVFYAFLQMGLAGPTAPEKAQAWEVPPWLQLSLGFDAEAQKKKKLLKLSSKWHSSTKGTLVRHFRVPSKSQGRRLLNGICSLLSDDDSFRDASSHKGCQVRRENAHAESVCCNNVRALLDELPTPHLVIEITVFPPGPIDESHYEKAQKLELVLKTGNAI